MPQPSQPHTALVRINHYGEQYAVYCIDREIPFPDGCLLTSRTDLNGIITHANDAFVLLSGWSRDELLGRPHSILHHPDMPAAAFRDMWSTLNAGHKWYGYVKNLRKDGSYYWVYATVVPNIRNGVIQGYTSVRRKPAPCKVREYSEFYAQLRQNEDTQAA